MTKTVRVHRLGGPEVLTIEDGEVGEPGPGEVRVKIEAIGLNRSEAMYRAGRYPVKPELPTLMGYEAAGVVEAIGEGVTDRAVGDRVCVLPRYRLGQYGVYAERAIVPAFSLEPVPPGLTSAEAASIWMQYMTAMAIIEVAEATVGDFVIIRAASSSVRPRRDPARQLDRRGADRRHAQQRKGRRADRPGRQACRRHRRDRSRRGSAEDHRRQGCPALPSIRSAAPISRRSPRRWASAASSSSTAV